MIVSCGRCRHTEPRVITGEGEEGIRPNAGDVWLCGGCGQLHQFTGVTLFGPGPIPGILVPVAQLRMAQADEIAHLGGPEVARLLLLRRQIWALRIRGEGARA